MNPSSRIAAAVAGAFLAASAAHAVTTSINSGSLGSGANGTNADLVTLGLSGALGAPGDTAAGYGGGTNNGANTTVAFNAALNPSATSPFTIEFWARPTGSDNDDAPVFNRVSAGDRSGWVFFQRDAATGWNFRMYNGSGSNVGHDLTGGTATLDSWSHVVAVWDGAAASLYVNGQNTAAADVGLGGYSASTAAIFSVGAYDSGSASFNGSVDETAFYATALTSAQILGHFNAAASTTPGAYSSLVQADGALLYFQNAQVPEPSSTGLMALGLIGWTALSRRTRRL